MIINYFNDTAKPVLEYHGTMVQLYHGTRVLEYR